MTTNNLILQALEKLPRLDLDGDGIVDAEELREAVLRVLKRHSNERAQELINLLDKDKDGQGEVLPRLCRQLRSTFLSLSL